LIVEKYNREDLIKKIKANLIYLHWWDVLTSDELIQSIVNNHFLKSTQKLIDSQLLYNYFQRRFNSKEILINYILQNFYPSESLLKFMKIESRGSLAFDYNCLFNNDFKRSIRIFENECRYEFNEKIIGCFYNEDLLFREVKRTFGESFKVISQGSPAWLTPQRFDIYFPDLNIAIEYQGEQHFRPVDFGGKGIIFAKKQFTENLKRDSSKREKAKTNNCSLFFVNPDYDIKLVLSNIRNEIKIKSNMIL